MEYLDYYDYEGNYLGYATRQDVHNKGLWHNTVHCWLYDLEGYVYFQIRQDTNTFYTTASGHVLKGETIKEAFKREIFEEIGLNIDTDDATLVNIVEFKMDKTLNDGTIFKDRAKANVYVDLFTGSIDDFHFDENEVIGIAKVQVDDALNLFNGKVDNIMAQLIKLKNNKNTLEEANVTIKDFLVNKGETAITKYGEILNKVKDLLKES